MKMKNMIATMTAVAVSAFSFAAMTASAAVTEIPYLGATEGALRFGDDGSTLRMNIYNIWGNKYEDIDPNVVVTDNVSVTFTISGLGTNSANTNDDGSAGEAYYAVLGGSIAGQAAWTPNENGNAPVSITGDGTYTVVWDLPMDSEKIDCLLISTNINVFNYAETVEDSGLNITIDKITTGVEDAPTEAPTDAPTEAPTDAPAAETTAPAAATTAAATTGGAAATTTTGGASASTSTTTNADTSDTGVAVALAGLTAAGALALVSRKRK